MLCRIAARVAAARELVAHQWRGAARQRGCVQEREGEAPSMRAQITPTATALHRRKAGSLMSSDTASLGCQMRVLVLSSGVKGGVSINRGRYFAVLIVRPPGPSATVCARCSYLRERLPTV